MTAILNALRALDARLDRGELTPQEHARRRAALLDTADDAIEHDAIDITPVRPATRTPEPPSTPAHAGASAAVGLGFVVVLIVMGACIALACILLGNMNLALTLGVTILAALSVTLLRHPDG